MNTLYYQKVSGSVVKLAAKRINKIYSHSSSENLTLLTRIAMSRGRRSSMGDSQGDSGTGTSCENNLSKLLYLHPRKKDEYNFYSKR